MAIVNIQVTPVQHQGGSPVSFTLEGGMRYAPVKLTIIASQTYATADRASLIHNAGSDFFTHFGSKTIKDVKAELFACSGVSTGLLKLYFDAATQRARLRLVGQGGGGVPAGPQAEANLADATALGAGLMTANAVIFW
jgi:hypothetical protein